MQWQGGILFCRAGHGGRRQVGDFPHIIQDLEQDQAESPECIH